MSRELIEAQEQERARIARELHDDIVQRLACWPSRTGADSSTTIPICLPRPAVVSANCGSRTSKIATDVQSLSHELHSSKLEVMGIVAAMRGFCESSVSSRKWRLISKPTIYPALCRQALVFAYSGYCKRPSTIPQNTVVYGDSKCDHGERPDEIHLTVRDSGAGFDLEAARKSRGLGLISMEERLKLVNGTFSVESQPQGGTTIHASVHYQLQ